MKMPENLTRYMSDSSKLGLDVFIAVKGLESSKEQEFALKIATDYVNGKSDTGALKSALASLANTYKERTIGRRKIEKLIELL